MLSRHDEALSGSIPPHALGIDELAARLDVDLARGLSRDEAEARRTRGVNRLPSPRRAGALGAFGSQLVSPLVIALLASAGIAAVVGARTAEGPFVARFGDALAILGIVLLNALLGTMQERRSTTVLEALESMAAPTAHVLRDGVVARVAAETLVVGDVVDIGAGDAVPADVRLIAATSLLADESTLTGESAAVEKDARCAVRADASVGDRHCMAFLGTMVVRGAARALVVAVGPDTEVGRIGEAIASMRRVPTPLEARLAVFGRRVLAGCVVLSAGLFAVRVALGHAPLPLALLEAVSFAVALIPEGLPAITSITLALGVQRMARRGAIVRRLAAVEALGAATVLCTDKTGTLTRNELTVRSLFADGKRWSVGEPSDAERPAPSGALGAANAVVRALVDAASVCVEGSAKDARDPVDNVLQSFASRNGASIDGSVLERAPFDPEQRVMSVVVREAHGSTTRFVKGAPETVLARCAHVRGSRGIQPLDAATRGALASELDAMSSEGMRVLAFGSGRGAIESDDDLTLLGFVGLIDPMRAEAPTSVEACTRAGIRCVMITGDHPLTARAIAEKSGLLGPGGRVLTGAELDALSDAELAASVANIAVFARTTPLQKLRVVHALRRAGEIVAMTGDGVNDAPALRAADVGVAMGRGGTDVARRAADVVITDDDLSTIAAAVREGRQIGANIRKFVFFLLASNAALAIAVYVLSLSSRGLPLTPLMILWINLVTNGLPALALGVDPDSDPEPRAATATSALLSARDLGWIGAIGTVMAAAALLLSVARSAGVARTLVFNVLAIAPLALAWSCRDPDAPAHRRRPILSVPLVLATCVSLGLQLLAVTAGRALFAAVPLGAIEWVLVAVASASVVLVFELGKALRARRHPR
jgi:Ca2+-transporting ATPase